MSMSKTTRERMATMVQKRQEEAEQRRIEETRRQRTDTDMIDSKFLSGFVPFGTRNEVMCDAHPGKRRLCVCVVHPGNRSTDVPGTEHVH